MSAVMDVAVIEQPQARAVSIFDGPVAEFRAALARRGDNRKALVAWVREAMIEGVDFGRIHVVGWAKCSHGNACTNPKHFSKPSLFKPGAEKICGMLGVTPQFPTLKDYEAAALAGREIFHIILRCDIVNADDKVMASGVGARSIETDSGDLNKALKMAEKSGHIDATLRMAGLSEIFTQDIEDIAARDALKGDSTQTVSAGTGQLKYITLDQETVLRDLAEEGGANRAQFLNFMKVQKLAEIPADQYIRAKTALESIRDGRTGSATR